MASTSQRQLLSLLLLWISIASTTARPCKTLLVSSYSFSLRQPQQQQPQFQSSSGFVTIFAEVTQFRRVNGEALIIHHDHHRHHQPQPQFVVEAEQQQALPGQTLRRLPLLPMPSSSYDLTSLRDRTKDILSVVVALLFGVGCGALTAATMYLAWSLFSSHHHDHDDEAEGEGEKEDGLSPKKMGYVKIPTADSKPTQW